MATEAIKQHQMEATNVETINRTTIDYDLTMQRVGAKADALQVLEPFRRKLASIEAERIISVIEKTIENLERATLLPHIAYNLNRFGVAIGLELTCALREHVRLEQHLHFAISKLNEEESSEEKNQKHKVKSKAERINDVKLLRHALGSSVKNILRLFQGNPSACQIIQMECKARKPPCVGLILALMKLKDFVFGRLLISPMEDKEKSQFVENIILQDRQNTEIIASLEAELAAAIQDKENEMLKKNEIIRKLKNNLLQLELFSEDYIRQIKQDAEKQQQADQKDSEGRVVKLQEEISQLRTQLNNLITEHRSSEQALRRRKFKTETEIENWIQKYDADIQEKQDEYEQFVKIHKDEGVLLFELEHKIELLESEYIQVVEDRKRRAEEKRAKEEQIYLMGKAAVTIQAFWKGYKVRQLMKSFKKKKKKGKGKRK
ncbi:dynein regulatory complex protein 10 [Pristis pectinata]|uniref:dynein regulatory complex protein 10 n=1 Tax=Pristis pectinata TaxID=685728 RepID=UPI00223D7B5A|nr:dynein regulatory complex protein 10 [Pristis pectinata]